MEDRRTREELTNGMHPASELAFVILMASDPEPSNRVGLQDAYCAVASRDSHRPNVLVLIDALEMKGWVKRRIAPEPERFSRGSLNLLRQSLIRFPKARQRSGFHSLS